MKRRGVTSVEHDETISLVCNILGANEGTNGSKKGVYYPDALNAITDFEIETAPNRTHILKKTKRWEENRKKVLILKPRNFAFEIFDEVYVVNANNVLIKISQCLDSKNL